MYWKVAEYKDCTGKVWCIYNYFTIIDVEPKKAPYYNGILKEIIYPQNRHLIIKACLLDPEEDIAEHIKKSCNGF